MTVCITDIIEALSAILTEHGDLVVMHHDDKTDFRVERVEFRPGSRPAAAAASLADQEEQRPAPQAPALLADDDWLQWEEPPHVRISGRTFVFDGNGGLVADVERPPAAARRPASPKLH